MQDKIKCLKDLLQKIGNTQVSCLLGSNLPADPKPQTKGPTHKYIHTKCQNLCCRCKIIHNPQAAVWQRRRVALADGTIVNQPQGTKLELVRVAVEHILALATYPPGLELRSFNTYVKLKVLILNI